MQGEGVALAALGVMATVVAGLVWLLKKLFNQNDTTIQNNNRIISELKDVIIEFKEALHKSREDEKEFRVRSLELLQKLSTNQDEIKETVNTTNSIVQNMTVEHMTVNHEVVKQKARKK